MFRNGFRDVAWEQLGPVGQRWELLRFPKKSPPTWEAYWADKRKYWDADAPDKRRVQLYFGATDTEQHLLDKCTKGYHEYCEYLLRWQGLCRAGDIVQVIPIEQNVVALSTDWKGEISDHSDLEIWLKQERTFFRRHVRFCCEIYSFGTIFVPQGGIEELMGERPGYSRVSHQRGRDVTV